jgi:hypothetical protein
MPLWVRALLVMPFAIVIDLGGAVASAFADARRRLGEAAHGWRLLSAASVALAVAINIVGHAASPYLATVFGGLGIFAYSVWLLHTSGRRRDALRAAGMLRTTAPAYGLLQWKREPTITWRARALAIDHGYGLVQSLAVARTQLAAETRRAALATHIEAKIRARHQQDPILAAIAATTTPIDDIAQELLNMIDAHGWARVISAAIQPPATANAPAKQPDKPQPRRDDARRDIGESPNTANNDAQIVDLPTELARMTPANPGAYGRWRNLWAEISERPDTANKLLADDLGISSRTVQRIRAVGAAGLLDLPSPPAGQAI